MTQRSMVAVLAAACALGAAAQAHHSIAGMYDSARQVNLEGVIARFHFVNPHPFLELTVADAGKTQVWTLEMDNRHELVAVGVTSDTFKAGDRVTVSGNPAYREIPKLYVRRLERATDGLLYEQRGSSPSIGRSSR